MKLQKVVGSDLSVWQKIFSFNFDIISYQSLSKDFELFWVSLKVPYFRLKQFIQSLNHKGLCKGVLSLYF